MQEQTFDDKKDIFLNNLSDLFGTESKGNKIRLTFKKGQLIRLFWPPQQIHQKTREKITASKIGG